MRRRRLFPGGGDRVPGHIIVHALACGRTVGDDPHPHTRPAFGRTRGGNMCTERPFGGMDRREFLRLGGGGLGGAVLLGTAGGRVFAQSGGSVEAEFEAAAEEHGVPRELLLAMGYVNTEWEM